MRQRTTSIVSLHHLKGFVVTMNPIEKIEKNRSFFDKIRNSLPTSNFVKKWPIFLDFFDGIHSDDKTLQMVQRDYGCGPLTHCIMMLKFEDFQKNRFFDDFFFGKIIPPLPGMDPALRNYFFHYNFINPKHRHSHCKVFRLITSRESIFIIFRNSKYQILKHAFISLF